MTEEYDWSQVGAIWVDLSGTTRIEIGGKVIVIKGDPSEETKDALRQLAESF